MEEKHDEEKKVDEIMLPGFRFHPTDEELVGFYLKRKIQHRPLSIELIRQLDIYKYDPWDLPKLACTGEKEWYFYCPRDRKYRNSARPNRVTGAGFWKATGTDRPIYSSEGSKCIGLKKSLVFYKGRAAKGVKTDWMMHEFRLPTLSDHVIPSNKRCVDKTIPACDSWAICRIFKKTNPVTPRTVSHSWVSPSLPNNTHSKQPINSTFSPNNIIKTNISSPQIQPNPINYNELDKMLLQSPNTFSYLDIPTFKTIHPLTTNDQLLFPSFIPTLLDGDDLPSSYLLPPLQDYSEHSKSSIDISSMLFDMSSNVVGDFDEHCEGNMTNFGWENNVEGQCHEFPPSTLPLEHNAGVDNVNYQDCLDNNLVNEDQSDYQNKCSLVSCLNNFPFYLTN